MRLKQPNFFLRKPDTLSLLYHLDEESRDRDKQLTVTMLAGFRLNPKPELLGEYCWALHAATQPVPISNRTLA